MAALVFTFCTASAHTVEDLHSLHRLPPLQYAKFSSNICFLINKLFELLCLFSVFLRAPVLHLNDKSLQLFQI